MIWKIDRTRLITPALIVSFVLLWHFYVTWFGVSKFIIPPPLEVWDALVDLLTTPSTLRHTWATLYETIVGFVFASVVGVALGTVLGKTPWLERAINPFIVATQFVPKVALVPLFILLFGFGPELEVVVRLPSKTLRESGHPHSAAQCQKATYAVQQTDNANRWQNFLSLELPSSLPAVLAGMEVGIVLSIIGAVVGEYLGGATGLGYLLVASMNNYKVGMLFAVILLLLLSHADTASSC
jgi:NitT/TauT family transport system permease protein